MRARASSSATRRPASSRYSKPRPRRRRVIPGPEQSTWRSLATCFPSDMASARARRRVAATTGRAAAGPRARARPRAGARAAAPACGAPLRRPDLGLRDGAGQLWGEALEGAPHALLVAADGPRELCGVPVPDGLGQRLDRRVGRDLLCLLGVLRLRVLELALRLARAANRVERALRERDRFGRRRLHRGGELGRPVAAELLDAPLDVASVALGLLQVLLEALLVRRARGERDVRLERGLELLLLRVGLVEVLDQLGFTLGRSHTSLRCRIDEASDYPAAGPLVVPLPGGVL